MAVADLRTRQACWFFLLMVLKSLNVLEKKIQRSVNTLICAICIGNSMICVVTLGVNITFDISKLLYAISRAVRRVKFETILKCHEWYLCQMSCTNHDIICLYYYPQKACNFHMQVFQIKLKYHCSKPIKLQKFLMQQYDSCKSCYLKAREIIRIWTKRA